MIGFLLAAAAATQTPDPIVGTWMNRKQTVVVATRRCGRRAICGRVIWAAAEAQERARAGGTDRLVGTELLQSLEPVGPRVWQGEVFVPDLGQSANAQLTLVDNSNIEIDGCQYGGLMCKKQYWHRVRATPGRQ